MLVDRDVCGIIHRSKRNDPPQEVCKLGFCTSRGPSLDHLADEIGIRRARRVGRTSRIVGKLRTPDRTYEVTPEMIRRTGDGNVPILGPEYPKRREDGMPVPFGLRHRSEVRVLMHDTLGDRQNGVHHRNIDELAPARTARFVYGRQYSERREHRRDDVADTGTNLEDCALGGACDADQTTHALRDNIVGGPIRVRAASGPRIAETAYRTIDQ